MPAKQRRATPAPTPAPAGPTKYRLRLEREDTGATVIAWSSIGAETIDPLLHRLRAVVPFLSSAARARRALTELLEAVAR